MVARPAFEKATHSLKFRVFRFGRNEDGDVRVSVLPDGKEILIGRLGLGGIALHGVGASQLQPGQRTSRKVAHHSAMVNELLKFRCRCIAVVKHQIRFSTDINRA
jgi:hypothetical protein